jgi:hypothetical protein
VPTSCTSLLDPGSVQALAAPVPVGGACSPSGAQPTGSVAPSAPVTVCCAP